MYITEKSLDDLLNGVYTSLKETGRPVETSKGRTIEQIGVLLQLTNPRARLSASETRLKPLSVLGEFIWYVAGSDDPALIGHYIPMYKEMNLQNGRIPGAYGPRMFGLPPHNDQFFKVIEVLKQRKNSRRAVIQLYKAEDLALSIETANSGELLDVPCTCTLQFFVRDDELQLFTHMRSNDAYRGLIHDVFCFTMLQELAARALGVEPGTYSHSVSSLHIYESDLSAVNSYLDEGWHNDIAMPSMPDGDQLVNVEKIVELERRARVGESIFELGELPAYWRDIAILISTHSELKRAAENKKPSILQLARESISCDAYKRYLQDRVHLISTSTSIVPKG